MAVETMHKRRVSKKKEVPAEKLTTVLTDGFAGMELFLAFSTSESSKRWIEQCLADFELTLSLRGTRYYFGKNFSRVDYFDDYDYYSSSDPASDPATEPNVENRDRADEEEFGDLRVMEVDNEFILIKSRSTLMKKQFGALRVYRITGGYRKTPLITVNMQFGQFMSIARQWGVKKDDGNLSEDPYYCWVEVPIPKPRRTPRRKNLTQ